MGFRRFFALLFALAMIAAPLGMPAMAAAAVAAPMESHHDDAAMSDRCGGTSDQGQPDKAADGGSCAAMCVAVVVPAAAADLPAYHAARERPASDLDRRGFLGEIATPPPRAA